MSEAIQTITTAQKYYKTALSGRRGDYLEAYNLLKLVYTYGTPTYLDALTKVAGIPAAEVEDMLRVVKVAKQINAIAPQVENGLLRLHNLYISARFIYVVFYSELNRATYYNLLKESVQDPALLQAFREQGGGGEAYLLYNAEADRYELDAKELFKALNNKIENHNINARNIKTTCASVEDAIKATTYNLGGGVDYPPIGIEPLIISKITTQVKEANRLEPDVKEAIEDIIDVYTEAAEAAAPRDAYLFPKEIVEKAKKARAEISQYKRVRVNFDIYEKNALLLGGEALRLRLCGSGTRIKK